jgi:3-dehydroquinate dehydratase-2
VAAQPKILVLNGPNLNMLGQREPEIYGRETLDDIKKSCAAKASKLAVSIDFRQSNSEGELVGWIQEARGKCAGIVINPAAYTHTSIAVMDALIAAELPVIEVHLSNIFRREAFRAHSYVSPVARGVICGLGPHGYELALEAMARIVREGKDR